MRSEESRAAGSHPQSNSNQGSPASACLPPTPHPITASTFPPTTLLLTDSTYYLTHTHTPHSVSLHTKADGWLVNNGGNKFRQRWCERSHMTWRCTAPPWGFLWQFPVWVSRCSNTDFLFHVFVITDAGRMTMQILFVHHSRTDSGLQENTTTQTADHTPHDQ